MAFGPRWPGSEAHRLVGDFIVEQLIQLGWAAEEQTFEVNGVPGRNIIGRRNEDAGPVLILGAHYDTRLIADRSPGASQPVPGAVDGASGVAALLELARCLDLHRIDNELWLVFFDLEDQGGGAMPGFDYAAGARHMAENLDVDVEAVVILDMIGSADQRLFFEGNSDPELSAEIWAVAAALGYGDTFIPEIGYTVIDDHLPFVERGITAIDIIDFRYAYWHTVDDTVDKTSAESLEKVGRTVETWLELRGAR
jgi:glutaminyl-peptide cyclotransferase